MDGQPVDLSAGERAILERLKRKAIDLRWGRSDWCPCGLPRPAKRADFDSLRKRRPALVDIKMGMLHLAEPINSEEA